MAKNNQRKKRKVVTTSRVDINASAAKVAPSLNITKPDDSLTPISNPLTAEGTIDPTTAVLTAWVADSNGHQTNGLRVDGGTTQNWKFQWPLGLAGYYLLTVKAQSGADSTSETVPIVVSP
jgi:hypothetical protein